MAFWEEFSFPDSYFFTYCPVVNLEPCRSQTAFAKQRLAFVDFCDDKIFFFSYFLFGVRIVTLSLHHYLFVLCLISPDFATCSVALHENVLSNVVKRLSTFPSLALSTLAKMCRRADWRFSHKDTSKWFRFFPGHDIPLRFIFLNVIFSAHIGRIHLIFV